MSLVDNVIIYQEDWATKVQERLSEATKWQEICKVEYTNSRVLNNPYMGDATVQTITRNSPYTHQAINETNEAITISDGYIIPQLIDRADLAQSDYAKQMDIADRQAIQLNEKVEAVAWAAQSQMTNFGAEDLATIGSAGTTQITVSTTNIDNIVLRVKATIRKNNGEAMANRNGIFFVWRPEDFEILEQFAQAYGFNMADAALKNGVSQGVYYMGAYHYSSNQLTANHVVAGVRGLLHLGIVRGTYGQVNVIQDPGNTSAIGVNTRVDVTAKVWTVTKPVLFDINVA